MAEDSPVPIKSPKKTWLTRITAAIRAMLPNAGWDAIKKLESLGGAGIVTGFYRILASFIRLPTDWLVTIAIFVVSFLCIAGAFAIRRGRAKKLSAPQASDVVLEPTTDLSLSSVRWFHERNRNRLLVIIATVLSIVAIIVILGWHIYKPCSVNSALIPVYETKLGECIGEAVKKRSVYKAQHQKGTVLVLEKEPEFFVLTHDDHHWESFHDTGIGKREDTYYMDEDNITRFGPLPSTSPQLAPPWGTLAKSWASDPENWKKRLGWRQWHCWFMPKIILKQEFEHGRIIGNFSRISGVEASEIDNQVEALILFDDHTWQVKWIDGNPPSCESPGTDKVSLEEFRKRWPN